MIKKITTTLSIVLLANLLLSQDAFADEKLRKIVLDNNTESDRHIKAYDKNGEKLFDKDVGDDKKFTIRGKGDNGALGDEIDIHLDGEYYTTISTGCTHVKLWDEIDLLEVEEIATIPCKDDNSKDDYDEGWDDGYDPGFEEGKDDACEKKTHKIDEEFDNDGTYDKGWKKGYTFGYEKGWKSCDEEEDTSSFDDGWDAGYHPGAEEAQADVCEQGEYHIDEEFSDESLYDRGWEKGFRKGYDYFYKKGCQIISKKVTREELLEMIANDEDYSKVDVSEITDMSKLFYLKKVKYDITGWNVSSVTNMSHMFKYVESFNQPIGDWDVSSVTNMSYMFVESRFNQPIEDWDVSSVTDMGYMFYEAYFFNQPIGDWDVSSVTDMRYMFKNAYSFNQPIGEWDVSSVKYNANFSRHSHLQESYKPKFK